MAEEYLENPRRAPRVRVRCAAAISSGAGAGTPLRASSEDVGPHGCQLVSPTPFAKGTPLQVELACQETRDLLRATGSVAWCSPRPPWRLGLAFTPESRPAATRFFDRLMAARPGLANWRRVPDKLSLDAMVWLSPPPTRVVDFTAEEIDLLRAVGSGATIYELRARLKERWSTGQRAFFSLLSSGAITLSRGSSAPYQAWSELLDRLESDLAPGPAPVRSSSAAPTAPPPQARPQPQARPLPPVAPIATPPQADPFARSAQPAPLRTVPPPRAAPLPAPQLPQAQPQPAGSPREPRLAEVRNDGSAGLDRELDLEAIGRSEEDALPLELHQVAPLEGVEEIVPLEIADDASLDHQRDWPSEPAADPLAAWPEPPPAKPRGKA